MKKLSFAATIKTLRLRNEISIQELSKLTGISREDLNASENGRPVRFSSYQITELADALFCNRKYLLDLYGWRKGDDTISDYLEFIGNADIWTDISDGFLPCFQNMGAARAAG